MAFARAIKTMVVIARLMVVVLVVHFGRLFGDLLGRACERQSVN